MDSLVAARLQMLVSLAFHMVYAAIGIGLPLLLVIVEALYLRTGQPHYKSLAKRWAKVIGLLFAVGAVSWANAKFIANKMQIDDSRATLEIVCFMGYL